MKSKATLVKVYHVLNCLVKAYLMSLVTVTKALKTQRLLVYTQKNYSTHQIRGGGGKKPVIEAYSWINEPY